jgi:N-glycosylase/DNA lyase
VSFKSISKLSPQARLKRFDEVFRVAKLRMPTRKAKWLNDNYDIINSLGGLKEAKRKAFAQKGTDAKIKFMKQFAGIGKKYARNIWMDVYHPDFHNTIAIDERIRQITDALGYEFPSYEDHEKFYLEIAKEANLQGWELDRLLYNFKGFFLKVL